MLKTARFTAEQIAAAKAHAAETPPDDLDPRVEALVNDLIGRVADKWTMLLLEVLAEKGGAALHPPERVGRRDQPKNAHPDLAPHGARRPGDEDRASRRAPQGRIQTNAARLEPRGDLLRSLGLGGGKPQTR